MITWLSHAGFKIEVTDPSTSSQKFIFIDPWFDSPLCPVSEKSPIQAELILITHGHQDHSGSAVFLSQQTKGTIVSTHDLGTYLKAHGASSTSSLNKGGTLDFGWVSVAMVKADHSGGVLDGTWIESPVGFVLKFADGTPSIYHAGDTNVFADMKTISELHQPKIALLPIGGHYTMGPREAAYAVNRLLVSVESVVPMHYGTRPILKGTPEEMEMWVQNISAEERREPVRVRKMNIGETVPIRQLLS
jgi:L-ascorbate metabolism protein UlaG (beta-lactamase superfamily)